MNRFLSSQLSNTLDVRTVVNTSATTDALTQQADALEVQADALEVRADATDVYVANLLESIRILQDVSYTNSFNAYTTIAQRRIATDMPYPAYVQIKTISDLQSTSTYVLNASGDLVSTGVNDDVWQIISTGSSTIVISSSSGVSLTQKYGLQNLQLLSTDGGETFHIGTQPGPAVYSGSFLQPTTSPGGVETVSDHSETAALRASNRWSLSLVPNYTPPVFTATELTRQLFQAKQPSATGNYAYTMWSYAAPTCNKKQWSTIPWELTSGY